jgi:DegV family protein with EDD domain
VYERAFSDGAEAIISIHVAGSLSGTIKSAEIAREMLGDREIHVVDSQGASRAQVILARIAVEMAAAGKPPIEIAEYLAQRASDLRMYVALETLEYLKKGGRISGTRAAIGTLLSVKPIISVEAGVVDQADRVRTRGKARERLIELITSRPIERLEILHTRAPDVEAFRDEVVARLDGRFDAAAVPIGLVGASVGPHVGPGCLGAAVLYEAET